MVRGDDRYMEIYPDYRDANLCLKLSSKSRFGKPAEYSSQTVSPCTTVTVLPSISQIRFREMAR